MQTKPLKREVVYWSRKYNLVLYFKRLEIKSFFEVDKMAFEILGCFFYVQLKKIPKPNWFFKLPHKRF